MKAGVFLVVAIGLCALIATAYGQWTSDKLTRYLLYSVNPGEGFNLARDVYTRAAALYTALNHTATRWVLVLPPFTNPHWPPGTESLSWHRVFDLQRLEEVVSEVITLKQFLDTVRTAPPQVDRIFHLQLSRPPTSGQWQLGIQALDRCGRNMAPLFQKGKGGHWDLSGMWGNEPNPSAAALSCLEMVGPAPLLASWLDALPFNTTVVMLARLETAAALHTNTNEYQAIRRSMVFACQLRERARAFMDARIAGRFIALHLRRADFLRVHRRNVPPITATQEMIERLAQSHDPWFTTIFVATDARASDTELQGFLDRTPLRVVRLQDDKMVEGFHPGQVAVMDQIVCTHADIFVGTAGSTFSRQIREERGIMGHKPGTSMTLTSNTSD